VNIDDLIRGLQIIQRSQPGSPVDIHDDTLFAGDFSAGMSDEDRAELDRLGFGDAEDSWTVTT
jgi:hypothetical protein